MPGLSSGQVTGALTALDSLPTLAAGSSVPGGSLAPLAAILSQIAAQPGAAPVASVLNGVIGTLSGSGAMSPTALQGLITTLRGTSGSLPSPLNTTVTQITTLLSGSGSLVPATGGGGGTGGSGGGTGGKSGGSGGSGGGSTAGHDGRALITGVKRHGRYVTITLHCTASRNGTCWTQVLVDKGSKQLAHKTFKFWGGTNKTITLRVPVTAVRAPGRAIASAR